MWRHRYLTENMQRNLVLGLVFWLKTDLTTRLCSMLLAEVV